MKKLVQLLAAILFLTACKTGQDSTKINFDTEQFFTNIQNADNCLHEGETFDKLGARVDAVIKAPIDTISSAATLKHLYYEAYQRQQTAGPRKSARCIDTNYAVKDRALEKLSTLGTEAAMDNFLAIYKDEKLVLFPNENKSMIRFMENFGPKLLQELEPLQNLRPQVGPPVVNKLKSQNQ